MDDIALRLPLQWVELRPSEIVGSLPHRIARWHALIASRPANRSGDQQRTDDGCLIQRLALHWLSSLVISSKPYQHRNKITSAARWSWPTNRHQLRPASLSDGRKYPCPCRHCGQLATIMSLTPFFNYLLGLDRCQLHHRYHCLPNLHPSAKKRYGYGRRPARYLYPGRR